MQKDERFIVYAVVYRENRRDSVKGTISYWAGILCAVLTLGIWALALLVVLAVSEPYSDLRTTLLAGITLLLGAILIYLPFLRRSCKFTLTDEYIEYTSGILYRMRRRISRRAVMVVTEMRTPVSYLCHTRTLMISAMGGSMMLPLLREKDAEALLTLLTPAERQKPEDKHEG